MGKEIKQQVEETSEYKNLPTFKEFRKMVLELRKNWYIASGEKR
jgi:hypothetical protein